MPKIYPVILSGGSGSRLWPLSRSLYPKQLLPLASERTMLQDTVSRMTGDEIYQAPLVICNEEHRFIVAEQLRAISVEPYAVVLEPEGRNTAPAVCLAAAMIGAEDPDALILVAPSDHVIADTTSFSNAVASAAAAATRDNALVTFGIRPDRPETGYGYIKEGPALAELNGCFSVAEFVEKPDLSLAESYVQAGTYYWNSGMFLFSAQAYLDEIQKWEPDILSCCERALAGKASDLDFVRLDAAAFVEAPSISIDYAVMERTDRAVVVPVSMGWSDVGSWASLSDILEQDENGNVSSGDVIGRRLTNTFVHTDGPLVAAIGLHDMVIVATKDAVLAVHKDHAQEVKDIVDELRHLGREEHEAHTVVYRPWGSYETIDEDAGFKVKRIVVNPGEQLSLQMHHQRAEHWIVVEGTAKVTRDNETFTLVKNQSTYIPLEATHRLENPGDIPLQLIEVQSGDYLGEDDIVRFEDTYGRS